MNMHVQMQDKPKTKRVAEPYVKPRKSMKPVKEFSYISKIKDASNAMNTLRMEMYGHDPHVLAEACGVSVACIYNIRGGYTKWPRPKTFFALINYLDLEMYLVKKS